jgi:hypothetical protein
MQHCREGRTNWTAVAVGPVRSEGIALQRALARPPARQTPPRHERRRETSGRERVRISVMTVHDPKCGPSDDAATQ